MRKKIEEIFFVSQIIASEKAAINCLCSEENSFHRQSMCQQTVL